MSFFSQFNSQSHLNHYSLAAGGAPRVAQPLQNGKVPMRDSLAYDPVNRNCSKIDAAMSVKTQKDGGMRRDENDDSDEGGFNSPSRPYVRGLRRQGSAVVGRPTGERESREVLRGRQYRSHRSRRKVVTQASPV